MTEFDVIWIGTGQATGTVVPRLVSAGKTVAIVESGRFGGSCVNYGCTPTKTIVASARAAHMARRGPDFGVNTGTFEIDFARVRERQNDIRNEASTGMESWLRNMENVTIFNEFGSFTGTHSVSVGAQEIEGETIVIHTGARPRVAPIPGLDGVDWLENSRLLDLEELPKHLLVIGGSYIGLEFSQAFRRFGSEVTVLERSPQLMFREDEDIAAATKEILEGEGIAIHVNAQVSRVTQETPQQIIIFFDENGEQKQVEGTHLLVAAGRVPNTDRLNLAAAGVVTNERGYVPVNEVMQTNVPHIFAVGDVNGDGAFTHTSVNDGEIFWDFYSGAGDRKLSDRIMTYAMFIDPPLGRVGMSEKEARKSGRNVLMGTKQMTDISRAKEKDETAGLVKILVDADNEQFLGATILGVGGDEIINIFTPFMYTKQSYKLFRRAVLIHPTVAELMPWILDDLKPLN
ncbi:MAG: mercuric reductase [Ardenticatenaceae bacterium]|nr:MAG: mercuric reductase [Ardenticatenaceae bacterium]